MQIWRDKPTLYDFGEAILAAHRTLAHEGQLAPAKLLRMENCFQNRLARDLVVPAIGVPTDSFMRCRNLLCWSCLDERRASYAKHTSELLAGSAAKAATMRLLLITLAGPVVPFFDASECVCDGVRQWQLLSDRRAFRHVADGHVRSMRLVPMHRTKTVYAQTNLLVLARRVETLRTADEWFQEWTSADDRGASRLLSFDCHDFSDRRAAVAIAEFADRVSEVAIAPHDLCEVQDGAVTCDAVKLNVLHEALRGRRLISFGGVLSRAAADADV